MAVEFAILLPFLALMFVGSLDFARVFYYQDVINNCARNGALIGSKLNPYQEVGDLSPENSAMNATLAEGSYLSPALTADQVTITYGTGSDGNPNVSVAIAYPFKSITNFPGLYSSVTLQAKVSMRVAP